MTRPFLADLVPAVAGSLGDVFPEFTERQASVMDTIRAEEEAFRRTLDRGLELFDEAADVARDRQDGTIRGEDAFKLHDTFGFPIDLTTVMAEERELAVDLGTYERLMEQARDRSRSRGDSDDPVLTLPPDQIAGLESRGIAATDDEAKFGAGPEAATIGAINWHGV